MNKKNIYDVCVFNSHENMPRKTEYYFKLNDEQLYLLDFLEKHNLLGEYIHYTADDLHEYVDLKHEFEDDY